MSRFITDAFFLMLLFLVAVGIFVKNSEESSQSVNKTVEDFDDSVSNGGTVSDGYLEGVDGIKEYEGNGVAKTVDKFGNIIVKSVDKVIEIVLKGVSGLLD